VISPVNTEWEKCLTDLPAKFVLLGVPEDIGVRANSGRPGAATAFKPAIDSFLNQQANGFIDASQIAVLGELDVDDLLFEAAGIDNRGADALSRLRAIVERIDRLHSEIIARIISLKKIPVIIGGGHNNSYGNITGAAKALGHPINVINCDPHLDFRALEGRHSGNGFSYAFEQGSLHRYAVFAMHEQYNNAYALQQFSLHPARLFFNTYESIFIREEKSFLKAVTECIGFVKGEKCGIEIDLDSITNVPSSAKTSSGISALQARQFVHQCADKVNAAYLHVAEGAPVLSHIKADNKTGKLIAYLITDFIKALQAKN
jgi:formiminoglutamase